jgi:hypothetical protein
MTLAGGLWHLVVGAALAGPGPAYATEEGEPRRFTAELTLTLHAPKLKAREWILSAAQPPTLAGQKAEASSLRPGGKAGRELSPAGRPVLRARIAATDGARRQGVTAHLKHEVVLRERRLVEAGKAKRPAPVEELTAEARQRALAATKLIDFRSAEVRKWLADRQLRRREGEHAVDFGRRAFLAVVKNFQYDFRSQMDRGAGAACRAGRSDCGGLSAVFVAALRANGVPARLRVGRWARSQKPGERLGDIDYGQQHVLAEFFAPDAGWVAADCASGVLYDKTPGRLDYFGHFRADFITLHVDAEMMLDGGPQGRQTVDWLQGMVYWVTGDGALAGLQEKQSWSVRAAH